MVLGQRYTVTRTGKDKLRDHVRDRSLKCHMSHVTGLCDRNCDCDEPSRSRFGFDSDWLSDKIPGYDAINFVLVKP